MVILVYLPPPLGNAILENASAPRVIRARIVLSRRATKNLDAAKRKTCLPTHGIPYSAMGAAVLSLRVQQSWPSVKQNVNAAMTLLFSKVV